MENSFRYVFGPVPSRRLGRSLGIDLVPFKTCPYDCVYCQLGRTTNKTMKRREYVPLNEVLLEFRRKLALCRPDYITLSGSGEPTLYSEMAGLIRGIKKETEIPVAVLTNGALLWDRKMAEGIMAADVVVPSLDAGDDEVFQRVNRPHPDVPFDRMVEGLVDFRARYTGTVWLEVFLLGGVTDTDERVAAIAEIARRIGPDKIQLNTVTRPPAEESAWPVPLKQMRRLSRLFGGQTEIIAEYQTPGQASGGMPSAGDVRALLDRRPCTVKDIADGLSVHPTQAAKLVEHLLETNDIVEHRVEGRVYYKPGKKGG